jgi:hypothetical protein
VVELRGFEPLTFSLPNNTVRYLGEAENQERPLAA